MSSRIPPSPCLPNGRTDLLLSRLTISTVSQFSQPRHAAGALSKSKKHEAHPAKLIHALRAAFTTSLSDGMIFLPEFLVRVDTCLLESGMSGVSSIGYV